VKADADIVALFDRHCERKRTISSLQPSRVWYRCFLHEDHTPSLCVWPDQRRWWCFSCGNGVSAIDAVMKLDGLEFVPAVLYLAGELGIEVKERQACRNGRVLVGAK
jgi:DNA primase